MFEGSDSPSKVASLVFSRLVACLSELQSLPTDDEYRYFAQFPEFRRITHELKSRAFHLLESVTSPAHFAAGVDGVADEARSRLLAVKKSLAQRGEDCKASYARLQLRFEEPVNNSVRVFVPADSQWRKLSAAMSCPILCEETIPCATAVARQSAAKDSGKQGEGMQLVGTIDQLHSAAARIANCKEIGVFVVCQTERSYRGFTRALAISTREEEFVIDAVALREHFAELQSVFSDRSVVKVMHRAEDWGQWLARDLGIASVNSFDLSKAAKTLKLPSATLSFLCKSYCGHEVDPQFSSIDWSCDSLTQSHISVIKSCVSATLRLYDLLREDLELKVGAAAVQSVIIESSDLHIETEDGEPKGTLKRLRKWRRGLARMTDQREETICPDEYLRKWSECPPSSLVELQSINQYVRAAAPFLLEVTRQPKRATGAVKHSSDVFERVGWKATASGAETSLKSLLDKPNFSELHIESLFGMDTLPSDAARGLSILTKMKKAGRLPYISLSQEVTVEEAESSYWDERRIPASIEDIYELSNANRKKAKKGKTGNESAADAPAAAQRLGDVQGLFKQLGWGVIDNSPRTKPL